MGRMRIASSEILSSPQRWVRNRSIADIYPFRGATMKRTSHTAATWPPQAVALHRPESQVPPTRPAMYNLSHQAVQRPIPTDAPHWASSMRDGAGPACHHQHAEHHDLDTHGADVERLAACIAIYQCHAASHAAGDHTPCMSQPAKGREEDDDGRRGMQTTCRERPRQHKHQVSISRRSCPNVIYMLGIHFSERNR